MNLFFWCGNTNQRTRWQVKKKGTRRYTTFHNSPFFLCKKKKENHIGRALFNSTRLSLSLLLFPFFFFTHLLYMVRTSPRGCVRCRLNVDWISSTATLRTRCLCCWGALLFFFLCSWLFPPPPSRSARQGNQANVRVSKTSLSISVRSSGAIHTRIREETKTLPCTIQTENPLTALYLDTNDMTPGRTTSIHALFQLGDEEEKKWRHFYASSP